jgi:hypothetical protein
MPSSEVLDILGKLIIALIIWYPSMTFIGNNDKCQLTMLTKYNYRGMQVSKA